MAENIKDRLFDDVCPGTPMKLDLDINGISTKGTFVYIGEQKFVEVKLEDNKIKYGRSQRISLDQINAAFPVEPLLYHFGLLK